MRYALACLALTLFGCCDEKTSVSVTVTDTTPLGVRLDLSRISDAAMRAQIPGWVDTQVALWLSARQGLEGYTEDELLAAARSEPVVVFPGGTVPGDGKKVESGYNWYGVQIQAAVYDTAADGSLFLDRGLGLNVLRHEWTHTVLGDFHP